MARGAAIGAVVLAAAVFAGPAAWAQSGADSLSGGVWRNPKNSVHVDIRPCGDAICGYVVWASPKAQADAKKGGTERLVGLQILRNFVQTKPGNWKGKVFVPDLNSTFSGTAELVDANHLKAKGCLIAGLACKTQTWTRIEGSGAVATR